jgi:tetratricopeptide (TPR) repeat protein
MIRALTVLIFGWILGVVTDRLFPTALPRTPAVVQNAATSIGLKPATPAVGVVPTGPLGASIKAEAAKNYDGALAELATFGQAGGDAFLYEERAGWLYYLKGSYPQAEQSYAEASRMHPGALNPLLGLLNVAQATKDQAKIHRTAEAILRIDPNNYRASMALAGRDLADHNYGGAAFLYRRILAVYPDDIDAGSGLAWSEFYTGDSRSAVGQFQAILSLYPDYPFARQGLDLASRPIAAGPPPRR